MPIRAQTLQREWAQGSYILNYYRKFDNQKKMKRLTSLGVQFGNFPTKHSSLNALLYQNSSKKKKEAIR